MADARMRQRKGSGGGFSLQLDKVGGATHFPSALEEDVLGVGEEEFGLDVLSGGL